MKTETKVIVGILIVTAGIIFGGITLFKKNMVTAGPQNYSKYVSTDLQLDQTKISSDYNPKITGSNVSTSTASTTKIFITEFLDYECPACATSGEILTKQLLEKYGDRIVITRKIFPIHNQGSIDSARLVLASQIFGGEVYEKVHTKFFETQRQWAILGRDDRLEFFKKMIIESGIDYEKLLTESQDKKYDDQIAQDKAAATALGVTATPSFIIGNHTRITGGLPLDEIVKYIDMK